MKIAVVGLGYVGLPLAVEFGKKHSAVGFDINAKRVAALQSVQNHILEVEQEDIKEARLISTPPPRSFSPTASCLFVTVPTPINEHKRPDFTPLVKASQTIGRMLKKGDQDIHESTVYPGATCSILPTLRRWASSITASGGNVSDQI